MRAEPRVVVMHLSVDRDEPRAAAITRQRWQAITKPFPPTVRGQVANLAAHNWTICAVDGTILIASPYGGGFIFFDDGMSKPLRPENNDVLFPRAGDQRRLSCWRKTRAERSDGVVVDRFPSEDGLWSLVHAGVFARTPRVAP